MPRRSKRMWSTMPVSSGPCSSPGFMKPTNSQVPPQPSHLAVFLHALSPPSLCDSSPQQKVGSGLNQTPQPARLLPAGLLGPSGSMRRAGPDCPQSRCSATLWVKQLNDY